MDEIGAKKEKTEKLKKINAEQKHSILHALSTVIR